VIAWELASIWIRYASRKGRPELKARNVLLKWPPAWSTHSPPLVRRPCWRRLLPAQLSLLAGGGSAAPCRGRRARGKSAASMGFVGWQAWLVEGLGVTQQTRRHMLASRICARSPGPPFWRWPPAMGFLGLVAWTTTRPDAGRTLEALHHRGWERGDPQRRSAQAVPGSAPSLAPLEPEANGLELFS